MGETPSNILPDYSRRLKKLRQELKKQDIDVFLITVPANRFYLSGFDGSAGFLMVGKYKAILVTDFRYLEQAEEQSSHLEIHPMKNHISETVAFLVNREGWSSLGFEGEHISYYNYKWLAERVKVPLIPLRQKVEKIRAIKESGELHLIKQAAGLTDKAFKIICSQVRPGIKEKDLAAELEHILKKSGGDKPAFQYIVASGPRSARPHGVASDKKLAEGEFVIFDFGVTVGGYASDMSRTLFVGKPAEKHLEIWKVVMEAQQAAINILRAGVNGAKVDAAARKVMGKKGWSENFGHGLGHGVGIEPHEAPLLSPKGKEKLVSGMVVTVEPGIYFKGWGGVRIEDMVLVTDDGCEVLTHSAREMIPF